MHPGLKLALAAMGIGAGISGAGNLLTPKTSYWRSVDRNAGGETPYTPEEQRGLRRKGLAQDIAGGATLGLYNILTGKGHDEYEGREARKKQALMAMLLAKQIEGAKLNPQKYGYLPDEYLAEGAKPDTDLW